MAQATNTYLLIGALCSFSAALLHYACIFWGADGFPVLGAGAPIVSMAESGHWYPAFIAFVVGTVLVFCALYALSGAGIVKPLPFLLAVLVCITVVYLIRALASSLLVSAFPRNSTTFWIVSSTICLLFGLLHLLGLLQAWKRI